MKILDNTLNVLGKGLDGAEQRHKVLANNIANVDTPNFKRKDVDFQSALKKEVGSGKSLSLARTNKSHLNGRANKNGFGIIQTSGRVREDGNNVNIDAEMAKVAENTAYYSTLATTVARKYQLIDDIIRKGGDR